MPFRFLNDGGRIPQQPSQDTGHGVNFGGKRWHEFDPTYQVN